MKLIIIIGLFLLLFSGNVIAEDNYIINGNTVYIDDSTVYLSATPHTLSSSGWVYFNLISKIYTGNIDACWGFNTTVSKPTKAEVYDPYWVNTTTNHEKTFFNSTFIIYTENDLDYGNSYNINYKYTVTEPIVNDNETTYIISNVSFDFFRKNCDDYTIYWHTRHDNYYLWKDFSSSFNSINHDYKGFNKWYYIKDIPIVKDKGYTVKVWMDVPINLESQKGKYYFAIKPSNETIHQSIVNGHFYNLDPWWNSTWTKRKEIILTGGTSGAQTDYQILLNISWVEGMQSDFDDLRFCNDSHKIDSWLESKVDSSYALVWIEFPTTPANMVEQTYYMYYGKVVANYWDGAATFEFFEDFESVGDWSYLSNYGASSYSFTASGGIGDMMVSAANSNHLVRYARTQSIPLTNRHMRIRFKGDTNTLVYVTNAAGTAFWRSAWVFYSPAAYTTYDEAWVDVNPSPISEIRIDTRGVVSGTQHNYFDFLLFRKYAANPPTYAFGAEESELTVESIHYNATSPYNHTIESDGAITVNRSITIADNINWTASAVSDDCYMVVTEYNLSNTTIANFTLYNASLDWLKVTNLTMGVMYRLTNNTIYESHTADINGEINFINNINCGDYQIMLSPADNKFYQTIKIIKNFPSTISNILTSFLSYLPLFIGILISGFLIIVCVGVFNKFKRW
jgi:hypothetical protein